MVARSLTTTFFAAAASLLVLSPATLSQPAASTAVPSSLNQTYNSPSDLQTTATPAFGQSYIVGLPAILHLLTTPPPTGWDIVQATVITDSNQLLAPYNFKISMDTLKEYQPTGEAAAIFSRGQRRSSIYVFRFPTPKAAYGAYSLLRQGASSYVVRGDASSEDDQSVTFWQDIYVVFATTTAAEDEEAKELLRKLADQVTQAIKNHQNLPDVITRLPYFQRVKGSEKLIMGSLGGRAVVPIPYIDFLFLEKSQGAAVADYKLEEPRPERLRLMVIDYGTPALAGLAYKNYLAAFGNDRIKSQSATWVLIKVGGTYLLCQQWGQKVILISGSHNRLSPQILAQQLRY